MRPLAPAVLKNRAMARSFRSLAILAVLSPLTAFVACVGSDPVAGVEDAAVTPTPSASSDGAVPPVPDAGADTSAPVDAAVPDTSTGDASDGGPAFSPKTIPDLALWLDAEQGLAPQSNVTNWVDQVSLTAVRGDQSYGAGTCAPPQRIPNEIKAHPVVRFNGTSTCLVMDDRFGGTFRDFTKGTTIVVVAKAGTATGARESVIDFSPAVGSSNDYLLLARDDQRAFHYVRNSNGPPFDDTSGSNASAFIAGETHIVTAVGNGGTAATYISGAQFQIYLDGTALAMTSTDTIVPPLLNRNMSLVGRFVGGNGQPTVNDPGWYRGDIGEILVFRRALTAAELGRVHDYLKAKWR